VGYISLHSRGTKAEEQVAYYVVVKRTQYAGVSMVGTRDATRKCRQLAVQGTCFHQVLLYSDGTRHPENEWRIIQSQILVICLE